jgi:hypothetical protein
VAAGPQPTPYQAGGPSGGYSLPTPAGYQEQRNYPVIGIPNELRNAVKVIVPFHSESASSERAAASGVPSRSARLVWTTRCG